MALSTDRELRVRMLLALGLIVCLPFVFVYTFFLFANTVGIELLEFVNDRPYHGEFYIDPLVVTGGILGGLVVQYWFGPRTVLGSLNTRPVDASEYSDLHATVTRLSAQVDIAKPTVAVIETEAPNAFAVAGGGDKRVVVTSALLEQLEDDELEAVLAHELAHLKNRDATLMTVAWLLPTITYYLAIMAFYILYGFYQLLGSGSSSGVSSGGDSDGRGLAVAIIVITVTAIATLLISAMFWLASVLFYRLLSRQREYAADEAAATITGSPAALASALETIETTMPDVPDRDLRKLDGGAEALYLAPLDDRAFSSQELISTDIFPDTHPSTAARIERLRARTGEQQ